MKTITVCKCYAITCITALTAQNSKGVHGVYPTPADHLSKMLKALEDDNLNLKAVKVGLLPAEDVHVVGQFFQRLAAKKFENIVLDPVFVANSGDSFGDSQAPELIKLFKYCRLVTPNFAETEIIASILRGDKQLQHIEVKDVSSLCDAAEFIGKHAHTSVLVKGGHIPFDKNEKGIDLDHPDIIYNVLYDCRSDETTIFRSHYIHSSNTHGTGCTMSSFIASHLAIGDKLSDAVGESISFLNEAIRRSYPKPNGPVNHLWMESKDFHHLTVPPFHPSVNLLDWLVKDKDLNEKWVRFTTDDFFRALNDGTMTDSALHHFLVQDYRYLKVFLDCHRRLQDLAPTAMSRKVMINATNAAETELAGHVKLLKNKYNIDDPTTIEPSKALSDYVEFMEDLIKTGNFVELETCLIPCQFGFNHAVARVYSPERTYSTSTGEFIEGSKDHCKPCKSQYKLWLDDAVSDQYHQVCKTMQGIYNSIFNDMRYKDEADLERIKQIFGRGCDLEYEFWHECYEA